MTAPRPASTTNPVPLLYTPASEAYDLGPNHPFKAFRAALTRSLLEHAALLDAAAVTPYAPATLEELTRVHSAAYIERVQRLSRRERVRDAADYGLNTDDTPAFPGMHDAAARIAGGTLHGARLIATGATRRAVHLAGGLHHAQRDKASGFCIYNDLSVAIADLRARDLRVAYIDIDAHHGDGVQWLHYDDQNVLTISLHETGRYLFPGTGFTYELGRGDAIGTSLNVPLEPFTEDDSFLEALERVTAPALEWFKPDVLVLQAGADAHAQDPLADLALTTQGFERAFELITELSEAHAGGRILATGGGGYAAWTAVPRAWAALYATLEERSLPDELPATWIAEWQDRAEDELPSVKRDPEPLIPRRDEIEKRNAQVVTRLLEDWRQVTRRG